jgi:uncharacterized membrane protein YfcA
MAISLILIILLSVVITSLISGIVGMAGDALLLIALSFAGLPLPHMAMLYAMGVLSACASRAFIHRKHISLKSMEYYMVGLLFALFIFGPLPGITPDKEVQDLLRVVGGLLLGIVLFVPFFSRGKIRPDFTKPPQALIAGVLSNGFIKSIDSHGFLLNLFFQDIAMTRYQVIGNKGVALLIPATLALVSAVQLNAAAVLPDDLLMTSIAIVPAAIAGTVFAARILPRLSDERFYAITRIILCVMGAICIGSAALFLMQLFPEIAGGKT